MRLTPQRARALFQERFVAEYLIDLNGTQAYLRAKGGQVSERTAASEAYKLLRIPDIQRRLAEGKQRQMHSADLSAARVLEELRRLAFFNPKLLYDATGRLRPVTDLPEEVAAALEGIEVAQANFDKTDGKKSDEWLYKVKWAKKDKSLIALAKHFKLITEVIEDRTPVDWDKRIARMRAARQRVGKKA